MKTLSILCVAFLGLICSGAATFQTGLKECYYHKTCPQAEEIIANMMQTFIKQDVNLSASIVRLHFHDCFVRGCDASVLLNSTKGNQAEKDAGPNLTLQGFQIIDKLKAALEKVCPGIVSCADILAYAARESVFHAGIHYRYNVRGGRKDGKISRAAEAVQNLPPSTGDLNTLIKMFAAKGLSSDEMVTLSGAHSIGVSHCPSLAGRQFSTYPPQSDLYLDPAYAAKLRHMCPKTGPTVAEFYMDTFTPVTLDNKYYVGLLQHKGLFTSDASLITKPRTKKLVQAYAQDPLLWAKKFVAAMIKMGEVQVKTGNHGEIRRKCYLVN